MEIKWSGKGNMTKPLDSHAKQVKVPDKTLSFVDKLQQVGEKVWRDKLDVLLEKIQAQGKILAKNRSLKELKKYKALVKSFMQEAIDSSLELRQNSGWNQWGKHRLLTIVEKVDERVDELTRLMLEGEEKTMAILDKLDEIRGLLLDLYT